MEAHLLRWSAVMPNLCIFCFNDLIQVKILELSKLTTESTSKPSQINRPNQIGSTEPYPINQPIDNGRVASAASIGTYSRFPDMMLDFDRLQWRQLPDDVQKRVCHMRKITHGVFHDSTLYFALRKGLDAEVSMKASTVIA